MEVLREGKKTEIYAFTTAELPADRAEQKAVQPEKKEWFGLHITSITPEIAKQLGLKAMDGVVVDTVDAGSIAQEAGLRRGDVIPWKSTARGSKMRLTTLRRWEIQRLVKGFFSW